MKFDHEAREDENDTATFNKTFNSESNAHENKLRAISETPQLEQSVQSRSIPLPQPLIHNQQQNNLREFQRNEVSHSSSNQNELNWHDPNLTFHPTHLLYDDKSMVKLKQEQKKLKEELKGLNEIVSQMLDKKYELVNEYESVIKQKKWYKRLMVNLEEEYEGYQSMLQGDYHIKVQEEIEAASKKHQEMKKQVHALNCELSKPLIKSMQQSDLKLEKLEREVFETEMFIEKQKALGVKKKEHLGELMSKIKQKEGNLRKLAKRIDQCEQLCEEEDLLPQESYKLMLEKFEQTKLKLARLAKINELSFKKRDLQYQGKLKALTEKDLLLYNIDHEIRNFQQRIRASEAQLQKIKAEQSVTLKGSLAQKDKGPKKSSNIKTSVKIESRYFRANTPQSFVQIQKSGEHTTPFRSLERRQNDYSSINSKAHRTMTEGDDSQSRQELSLRKKRIYTELEKNMYFKKIEHSQIEKLSRILQGSDLVESPASHKQNSRVKLIKLPKIHNAQASRQEQAANESIIEQAKFSDIQAQRKTKKKSIEMHNKYIKQLKANRQALNRSNYQELCNILNRDKLLIEEECEYQIGDLIYNSRF